MSKPTTRPFIAASCLAFLLPAWGFAQSEEAKVDWQKRQAVITYGVPRVGKHAIDELQVGTTWRMGRNNASVLTTETALFGPELVIPPGAYRCNVHRSSQDSFAFNLDGASYAFDPGSAESTTSFTGDLSKIEKPTSVLELAIKPKKPVATNLPVTVSVRFGTHELNVPMNLAGAKSLKSGTWTLDVYSLPAEVVEKLLESGKPIPMATLKKEPLDKKNPVMFNLAVTKTAATWCPPMKAPTASYGFAPVEKPSEGSIVKAASVTWADVTDKKPTLEPQSFDAKKNELQIKLISGSKTVTVVTPDPATSQKPSK